MHVRVCLRATAVVDYDDGDTENREPGKAAVELHPNHIRAWGVVTRIDPPAAAGGPRSLQVTMLEPAFDANGSAVEASYNGPELFAGMKIEHDYPPFKLGDRCMQVPDTEAAVLNAGTLFAYDEPLFYGIDNADDEDHLRRMDMAAGAERRASIGSRRLPSVAAVARHTRELDDLRESFVTFVGQVRATVR